MSTIFDWAEYAFKSKKEIKDLKPIFVAAPREISQKRFIQLIKEYLPQGNILLGIAKETYIDGFEDQPQFKTLRFEDVKSTIEKIQSSNSKNKVYVLHYFQRELPHILEKLKFKKAIFVNGSWYKMFHTRPEYYALVNNKIEYEMVSPFVNEEEAKSYASTIPPQSPLYQRGEARSAGGMSDEEVMYIVSKVATHSFATDFQTACALVKDGKVLLATYNKVVPYETYAWHFGSAKEKHFSPPNDLNQYDTNHAEVELLIQAAEKRIDLAGTSLFINLLPCPTCTRMLCSTKIEEFVYQHDHSDGYALKMLEKAEKKVRRVL